MADKDLLLPAARGLLEIICQEFVAASDRRQVNAAIEGEMEALKRVSAAANSLMTALDGVPWLSSDALFNELEMMSGVSERQAESLAQGKVPTKAMPDRAEFLAALLHFWVDWLGQPLGRTVGVRPEWDGGPGPSTETRGSTVDFLKKAGNPACAVKGQPSITSDMAGHAIGRFGRQNQSGMAD